MVDRTTKLRWRRRFRRSQKHVENIGANAEEDLEQYFFRRLNRLVNVRRFVIGWVALLLLLITGVVIQTRALSKYYLSLQPAPGGVFTEGITGSFTNANPLYASGSVDSAVSKLVFSGLMKYDANNRLVGDLAQNISADSRAATFTVVLRPGLKWHDGKPLTADDVVFTYKTIQNPDAKSPLFNNWQSVKIEAKDARTIVFTLPHGLVSFPNSLTNGIVPKHLLDNIPASQLRSVAFNTANPVGSGAFKWETVEVQGKTPDTREERVGLVPNPGYHFGAPKLARFTIRAFHDQTQMVQSFKRQELSAMAGLETMPDELAKEPGIVEYNVPLTGEVMVFLKNTDPILQDRKVREALTRATNQQEILTGLGYPVVPANSPFLKSHVGYSKNTQLDYNVEDAKKLLDEAGWKVGKDGMRFKDGKPLTFHLYSQSNSQYAYVTQVLQRQWRAVGVDAQVVLQPESDLESTISFHNYDALLYGVSLGPDPDVFAYWHSSQADPRSANRLNFSEYKSSVADQSLEGGRARVDANLRAIKYKAFLDVWRNDAPAIALYQPRFLYVSQDTIYNFHPKVFNTPTDRYANVQNWETREERQSE
jgi:peptide/nickel transport system substrate-binding protein